MKLAVTLPTKRMLTKIEAANYCGFKSSAGFDRWCPVAAVRIGNKVLYDLRAIDLWLDALGTSEASTDKRGFAERAGNG